MPSSVCSFKLREAASTESAIITIAVSFEKGFGPGYMNNDSSTGLSGN